MASAGRILIIPKGNYDANTEYEMLDLVFHNGASWIAKRNVQGIEPAVLNEGFWMKMCDSTDLTDIENRVKALEELDTSQYAKQSDVASLNASVSNLGVELNNAEQDIANLNSAISSLNSSVSGLSASAIIKTASYKGEGTYGIDNPCSITSDKPIKIILYLGYHLNDGTSVYQDSPLARGQIYTDTVIFCDHLTTSYQSGIGFHEINSLTPSPNSIPYAKKSADGKTVYWYVSGGNDASRQLNNSSRTYYFLVIS